MLTSQSEGFVLNKFSWAGCEVSRHSQDRLRSLMSMGYFTNTKLTYAALPANKRKINRTIIGYAVWKGAIDWSTSEVPVLLYAETT